MDPRSSRGQTRGIPQRVASGDLRLQSGDFTNPNQSSHPRDAFGVAPFPDTGPVRRSHASGSEKEGDGIVWQVMAIIEGGVLALIGVGMWVANRSLDNERL